ncbi:MAG: hypothetical protein ABJF16_15450 [Lentilitoribacter sp.]
MPANKKDRVFSLAEAILVYQLEKIAVIFGGSSFGLDPYLPFRAEQAGQLAYFKALGYKCRPSARRFNQEGKIINGTPPPMADEDKEKLRSALKNPAGLYEITNV